MKKVVYVVILILFIGIAVSSKIILEDAKSKNKVLEKKITETTNKVDNLKKDNQELEDSIDTVKEEVKDKIEEYEIWEKAKNKLNQAL